jgi:hypothetical protein
VFEHKYPLATVTTTFRAGSDHVPLVVNFGINQTFNPPLFILKSDGWRKKGLEK